MDQYSKLLDYVVTHGMCVVPSFAPFSDPSSGGYYCSCGNANCKFPGKHPREPFRRKRSLPTPERLAAWCKDDTLLNPYNWQVIPELSGRIIVDVDPRHDGDVTLQKLESVYGKLPVTQTVQTGGGGLQFHFCAPAALGLDLQGYTIGRGECGIPADAKQTGLELLSGWRLVTIPPSLHKSGHCYRWAPGRAPGEVPLAELPDWVIELARQQDREKEEKAQALRSNGNGHATDSTRDTITDGPFFDGERGNGLFRIACRLRARGMEFADLATELQSINSQICRPPKTAREVDGIAKSACRYPAGGRSSNGKPNGKPRRPSKTKKVTTAPAPPPFTAAEMDGISAAMEDEAAQRTAAEARVAETLHLAARREFPCRDPYVVFIARPEKSQLTRRRCERWVCHGCHDLHEKQWTENIKLRLHMAAPTGLWVGHVSRQAWKSRVRRRVHRARGQHFNAWNGSPNTFLVVTSKPVAGFEPIDKEAAESELIRCVRDPWTRKHIHASRGWRIPRLEIKTGEYKRIGPISPLLSQEVIQEIAAANSVQIRHKDIPESSRPWVTQKTQFYHPWGWTWDDVYHFYQQLADGAATGPRGQSLADGHVERHGTQWTFSPDLELAATGTDSSG